MGQFASYVKRVLRKTRLIFSRINGPIDDENRAISRWEIFQLSQNTFFKAPDSSVVFVTATARVTPAITCAFQNAVFNSRAGYIGKVNLQNITITLFKAEHWGH